MGIYRELWKGVVLLSKNTHEMRTLLNNDTFCFPKNSSFNPERRTSHILCRDYILD